MTIGNFNSLFELSAALNIGYASIPQLAEAIKQYYFKKIYREIDELKYKTTALEARFIIAEKEGSFFSPEQQKLITKKTQKEILDTESIKNKIESDISNLKKIIANNTRIYFIIASLISIAFLIIGGFEKVDAQNITIQNILFIYLITFVYILVNFFLEHVFSYEKTFWILFLSVIISILACYLSEKYNIIFNDYFGFSYKQIITFMLCTVWFPFMLVIPFYVFGSKKILKKYKNSLDKQMTDIKNTLVSVDTLSSESHNEITNIDKFKIDE